MWDQGQKIGKSDAFMGLAIVSVSELLATASQRHVVPLQGRPYEEDKVGPCSPNTALYRLPYSLERDRRIIFRLFSMSGFQLFKRGLYILPFYLCPCQPMGEAGRTLASNNVIFVPGDWPPNCGISLQRSPLPRLPSHQPTSWKHSAPALL